MTMVGRAKRNKIPNICMAWPAVAAFVLCMLMPRPLWSADSLPRVIEQDLGQMLIVGFRGLSVNEASPVMEDIRKRNIGGVVLFDYDVPAGSSIRNIASPGQLRALTDALQSAASTTLFIAVDEEGGRVSRLKSRFGFPPTVSAGYLGARDDLETTRRYAAMTAETLRTAGINLNFAPVVDLNLNPDNPVIGKLERSYSAKPAVVIRHARVVIDEFHRCGIITAVKHFPGHGSSAGDTHLGVVDVTRLWDPAELMPFESLIRSGACDMVMTAHIFNGTLDPVWPATLSGNVVTGILRERLGYEGIVVSDDMQMGAIRSRYGLETAIEKALGAGCDILVFANNSVFEEDIAGRALDIMKKLISDGTIDTARIMKSLERIRRLKEGIKDKGEKR